MHKTKAKKKTRNIVIQNLEKDVIKKLDEFRTKKDINADSKAVRKMILTCMDFEELTINQREEIALLKRQLNIFKEAWKGYYNVKHTLNEMTAIIDNSKADDSKLSEIESESSLVTIDTEY